MAPAYAVPAMLRDANLTLQDFDFYEIHEAFAAQVLCTLKAWESPEYCKERLGLDRPLGSIDRAKLNVNGSSVAIGHPFAATGTRIVAQLAKQLSESATAKRGLISVCTAGGMGVVAILEKAERCRRRFRAAISCALEDAFAEPSKFPGTVPSNWFQMKLNSAAR